MDKSGTIFFPNTSCVALWNEELTGQISDGMWENSRPWEHYKFWCALEAQVGPEPRVIREGYARPTRMGYNFAALYPIVGDRMLRKGRMGLHTVEPNAVRAAEYMPETLEEFRACKASGKWKYDFVKDYMDHVSDELARMYYASYYTMKDLKRDIASIKLAMKQAGYVPAVARR